MSHTATLILGQIEQDHRGITQRYSPLRGFGSFAAAARFCSAHNEVRDYVRHRTTPYELVPLVIQRAQFRARLADLRARIQVA